MIDVDNLKATNDRFGHAAGDAALRAVGQVLKASLRSTDIAGRYGGDEFVIAMPETDESAAQSAAERIRRLVAERNRADSGEVPVGISIGVAVAWDNRSSILEQADAAMYTEKRRRQRRPRLG